MATNLPVFLTGMDIVLTIRRVVTSVCRRLFQEKHMILQFPATNLSAWVHCMKFLKMLQNIRKLAVIKLSQNCLDKPRKKSFF